MFHETLVAPPQDPARREAFTRIELLAALVTLGLIVACALPALAASASRSHVAQCLNNLRLIGRAAQMWAGEHVNELSWRTPLQDGGEYFAGPRPGNAWFEYWFLSNQIVTPRILACPADSGVRIAREWEEYTSAGFRDKATSYTIDMHASTAYPRAPLFTDRNLRLDIGVGGCSFANVNNLYQITLPNPGTGWTNAVHGPEGNIVMVDGSVTTTSSTELQTALGYAEPANGIVHFLKPR